MTGFRSINLRDRLRHIDQRWGLHDNRRLLIFIFACSIVPAVVLLTVSYQQAISNAQSALGNAIDIAVRQTDKLLTDGELLLRRIAADIDVPNTSATHKLLLRSVYTDMRFRAAGIVDSEGMIVSTSIGVADLPRPMAKDIGFDADNAEMQILGPRRELIMQEMSIALALRGRDRQIAYLLVDPALLTFFLDIIPDLDLGPQGAIGFQTDDGRLLGGVGDGRALEALRQDSAGGSQLHILRSTEHGRVHVIGKIPKRWTLRHWYKSLWFGAPLSLLASAFLIVVFLRRTGAVGNLDDDLRLALSRQQFQVLYQPIIDLRTGCCIGAEALLRWHHPNQGMVLPGLFIPMAEKTGIIVDMTDWLVDRVIRDQPTILGAAAGEVHTSINISCVQLNKGQVQRLISGTDQLKSHSICSSLILEITESESINDSNPTFWESIATLHRHGARLAIDDFGTGYSNMAYLNRLHLEFMKIDRHFVQGGDEPNHATVVLDSIIGLGRQLGLTLIAEGIETEEQREVLVARDVAYGQGWLFSHPLSLDDYVSFLQK